MAENEELEVAPAEEAEIEAVEEEVPYTEVDPVELDPLTPEEENYTNRAFLFREYVLAGKSMKQIAQDAGVDDLAVKKYLTDYDLYDRTRE